MNREFFQEKFQLFQKRIKEENERREVVRNENFILFLTIYGKINLNLAKRNVTYSCPIMAIDGLLTFWNHNASNISWLKMFFPEK